MYYPLSYRKIAGQRYAVYCSDKFAGEVAMIDNAWRFRTFHVPVFVSPLPAHTRSQAVLQWPGLSGLCE